MKEQAAVGSAAKQILTLFNACSAADQQAAWREMLMQGYEMRALIVRRTGSRSSDPWVVVAGRLPSRLAVLTHRLAR